MDNRLPLWQKNLKKKFDEIEELYYLEIDELTQTIADLDLPGIPLVPDFTLTEFSFVRDWESGNMTSAQVCAVFQRMDLKGASKSKLTKRLINFMINNEVIADYFKPVIDRLHSSCLEKMIRYLEVMYKFFSKMAEIDAQQMKLTWMEHTIKGSSGEIKTTTWEATLNQVIKQLDIYVVPNVKRKFFVDDNIIVLDEIATDESTQSESRTIHWLFAPASYIKMLKNLYQIKEPLADKEDKDYLKHILASQE